MMSVAPQAEPTEVERFLRELTRGWEELGDPVLEVRSISETRQVHAARFKLNDIDLAVDHLLKMNQYHQNAYAMVNPVKPDAVIEAGKGAKDGDIMAALHCFADADTEGGMKNILTFAGPRFTMSVRTGTTPFVRGHAYWRLEEPCLNLDAWREVQRSIAHSLGTDGMVINPSRIMRVAGTVSWPNADKRAKGYIPELVTMRTEFSEDRDPVPFERLMRAFPPVKHVTSSPTSDMFALDLGRQAMDRALAEQSVLSGDNWHHNVVRLVGSYVSRGLSDAEIHALTDRFTMSGYTVDDTRREVQQAIDGARSKGWTPPPEPAMQRMEQSAAAIRSFDAEPDQPAAEAPKADWPTPLAKIEELSLPRRQWIYGRDHIRGFVSVTASAGGIGKTSMTMVECLAVATGRDLLGDRVHDQCNVWLVNLEDDMSEMRLRLAAAMKHYHVHHDDIDGRFYMDAEDTIDLIMAAEGRDGVTMNDALLNHMIDKVRDNQIGLMVLDPFVSSHMVNENSNSSIQHVVAMFRRLARETGCGVHIVHHVRKGGGEDATVDSVRGAGSLIGAARSARVINRVSEDDAMRLGIPEADAPTLFRVDPGKANLAPPADRAVYRRMESVELANGESIGVCVAYKLPDLFDGITTADAMRVQRAVGQAAEDEPLRANQQSKTWVGYTVADVLGLDIEDEKARVKVIIKTWIDTDVLRIERFPDAKQGRDVPCVVVGKWITGEEAGLY